MTATLVPAEAFPPGVYLRDELEARGWTAKEFAEILGRPVQAISEILNGHKQIVPETALAIGEALGTSADMWLNLQTAYNLHQARSSRPQVTAISRRSSLRAKVPISELRNRGWLPSTEDEDTLEEAVKNLLGITDLSEEPDFAVAARRSEPDIAFTPQQMAWLSRVRQIASDREVGPYQPAEVNELASTLVHRVHDPTDLAVLPRLTAECGIVLINLLHLRSSKIDGAVMILDSGNPVIGLSSRGDRMDSYVFTLLHELAHLYLHHLDASGLLLDEDLSPVLEGPDFENEANMVAANWILPEDLALPAGRPTMSAVLDLARQSRVHPSFVIGRLQREREDWGLFRRSIPRVRPYVMVEN